MDLIALAGAAQSLGIIGFLFLSIVVILVGLYRRWWYPRPYVDDMREELEAWKAEAQRGRRVTEVAVDKVPKGD